MSQKERNRENQRRWYAKNKEWAKECRRRYYSENSERCKESLLRHRDKKQKKIWEHKEAIGCSRCGYTKHGAALDWHHVNDDKEERLTAGNYFSVVGKSERAKCILLCANCHREEHATERTRAMKTPREIQLEAEVEELKRINHILQTPDGLSAAHPAPILQVALDTETLKLLCNVKIKRKIDGIEYFGVTRSDEGRYPQQYELSMWVSSTAIRSEADAIHALEELNRNIQDHLLGALLEPSIKSSHNPYPAIEKVVEILNSPNKLNAKEI